MTIKQFEKNNAFELKRCLTCGSNNLKMTLDLGKQPLANSFKKLKDEIQEEYPLCINRCGDCYHVQLTHAVNPDLLFVDYAYVSGTTKTMHDYMKWFAEWVIEYYEIIHKKKPLNVLDIGCNDGTQLDYFKSNNIETIGIDPAENLYSLSSSKGHKIYPKFFDENFILNENDNLDIIVAQNVFAHNFDPRAFMQTLEKIVDDESLFFVQTSQSDMIKNNEFDTIYHEHISFYNIKSMKSLCERTGFYLMDVVKSPIHGSSYIFVITKNKNLFRKSHIDNLISMESFLYEENTYIQYKENILTNVQNLKKTVESFREKNYKIVGYGAAAKGMTLLNFAKLELDLIIDDNPLKQEKYTPGMSTVIKSIEILNEIEKNQPIAFIPLAWNFFNEITHRIKKYRDNDIDKFIKYFPKVAVS